MKRRQFIKLAGATAALGLPDRLFGQSLFESSKPKQYGVWMSLYNTPEEWKRRLELMHKSGITMIIPNTPHEKLDALNTLVPIAADNGIDVHVWRVTMLNEEPLKTHPDWYGVSRSGKSTADKPPYVPYYRFMCPNRTEVQEFLRERFRTLASVPGIKSVHLDYIRYPDVILPVGLWPKYNIVQDKEYPDYDFCYCEVCRKAFREKTGMDPLDLPDPPTDNDWIHFRWNSITSLVSKFYDDVHAHGKLLTGAVFPTPEIARALVRQDWVNWKIDAVMPMMYHNFYNQPVSWVGQATREGVAALKGKKPLYSGVFIPNLTPDEMTTATHDALSAGAAGVIYFDDKNMSDAHWSALAKITAAT